VTGRVELTQARKIIHFFSQVRKKNPSWEAQRAGTELFVNTRPS
jgi:hypothetical protein